MIQKFEENVSDSFTIGSSDIPPGIYNFEGFTGVYSSTNTKPVFLMTNIYAGTFFDGTRYTIGLSPTWTLSSSVNLGLRYEYNYGEFEKRNQQFNIHLVGLKTTLMFNTKLSATLYVQYNSDDEEAATDEFHSSSFPHPSQTSNP